MVFIEGAILFTSESTARFIEEMRHRSEQPALLISETTSSAISESPCPCGLISTFIKSPVSLEIERISENSAIWAVSSPESPPVFTGSAFSSSMSSSQTFLFSPVSLFTFLSWMTASLPSFVFLTSISQ